MNPEETFMCGQRPGAVLMEDKQGVCVFVPCEPTGRFLSMIGQGSTAAAAWTSAARSIRMLQAILDGEPI